MSWQRLCGYLLGYFVLSLANFSIPSDLATLCRESVKAPGHYLFCKLGTFMLAHSFLHMLSV